MAKLALFQRKQSNFSKSIFIGFIEREIQEKRVEFAPSFSGKGPFGPTTYSYVEVSGMAWPYSEQGLYLDHGDGGALEPVAWEGVIIGPTTEIPEDVEYDSRFKEI